MKVESLTAHATQTPFARPDAGPSPARIHHGTERFHPHGRKDPTASEGPSPGDDRVPAKEILDKIREISRDGLYSVRFEKNEELGELVVKIVDRTTEEVIRQIPPEAILGVKAYLREYLGNIVNKAY
ncbi:MAG: flagellar protein FlaG [Deltaproteobacteria bacterium]|nr:flagellar protein FlaG [Deltaproteobacteria bacterium]